MFMNKKLPSFSKGKYDEPTKEIKEAFDRFDILRKGTVIVQELREAMISSGLSEKNKVIFDMLTDLSKKSTDIDFETYLDAMNRVIGERKSNEGLRRMFKFFTNNNEEESISLRELKALAKDADVEMEIEELSQLISKIAKNGSEITFDEFNELMYTK